MSTRSDNAREKTAARIRHNLKTFYDNWEEYRGDDDYYHFRNAYWNMWNLVHDGDNSVRNNETLLEYTVKYIKSVPLVDSHQGLSMDQSNKLVEFFESDSTRAAFTSQAEGDTALLWFLLDHSTTYIYQDNAGYVDTYRRVLTAATGKQFPRDKAPRLDNVVEHFYGPSLWAICGIDLHDAVDEYDTHKVITEIFALRLPSPILASVQPEEHRDKIAMLLPETFTT